LNKTKAKLLLIIIAAILFAGIIIFISNKNNIKLDTNLGTLVSEQKINLILDEKKTNFSIKSYMQNNVSKNYLFKNNLFKIKRIELLGFEDNISLCNKKVIRLRDIEAVCLVGDVGVHSQTISFVSSNMLLVKIIEGKNIFRYIVSDSPNYLVLDYNNDGVDDLIVDNRNYNENPLVDIVRKYYAGSDNDFVFDREEYLEVK